MTTVKKSARKKMGEGAAGRQQGSWGDREEGTQRQLNTLWSCFVKGCYSNSSREMTLSQTDALLQSRNPQHNNKATYWEAISTCELKKDVRTVTAISLRLSAFAKLTNFPPSILHMPVPDIACLLQSASWGKGKQHIDNRLGLKYLKLFY